MSGKIDPSTLERLVPDELGADDATGKETFRLHLERYSFAAAHVGQGQVLDLACGVGYGTRFLKDNSAADSVTGIDVAEEAIAYARARYGGPGVSFGVSDGMTFSGGPYDAIVSLETIEHVDEPRRFVCRLVEKLLRTDGIFVGSVPVTPSVDANPHHRTDFTIKSFRNLLSESGLQEISALEQSQPYDFLAVAKRTEPRMKGMRSNMLGFYLRHPGKAVLRAKSVIFDGFNNKYLTLACRKRG